MLAPASLCLAPQRDGRSDKPGHDTPEQAARRTAMAAFILPLTDAAATDAENVGPKAANLASLTQAGLPTPGGFALTAAAYRHQLRHLGIEDLLKQYNEADLPTLAQAVGADQARALRKADRARHSGAAARRLARAAGRGCARRGAFLRADRGPQGRQFRRPVRKLPRPHRRDRIRHRRARLLGGAVDLACAPLHGQCRSLARRHRDGRADPAARRRARVRRGPKRNRRRARC